MTSFVLRSVARPCRVTVPARTADPPRFAALLAEHRAAVQAEWARLWREGVSAMLDGPALTGKRQAAGGGVMVFRTPARFRDVTVESADDLYELHWWPRRQPVEPVWTD